MRRSPPSALAIGLLCCAGAVDAQREPDATPYGSAAAELGSEVAVLGSTVAALGPTVVALGSTVAALDPTVAALGSTVAALGSKVAALRVDVARLLRDPDRGLAPALRERLALVDASRDGWAVERQAALVEARLRVVADLWSEERLAELAQEPWIAPGLLVAPLSAADPARAEVRGPWSHLRTSAPPDTSAGTAPRVGLARALALWRDEFSAEARLACEVFALAGGDEQLEARVRVTASGADGAGRIQHTALWSTTWRLRPTGLELVGLQPESFEALALAGHPGGLFRDVTASVLAGEPHLARELGPGLDEWRRSIAAPLFPGSLGHHGLALADVNGDGLEDVYLCRPGGLPNKLLLRTPEQRVVDASAEAGVDLLDYSSSALLCDLDGDRDADLLVATATGLSFFANDGRARFTQAHWIERSLATSLAAADYDGDGDLDVYVCSYVSPFEQSGLPVPYHAAENGEPNMLLRNDGGWAFVDATSAAGMDANDARFSLAAAWEDYDNDGDQDLYVANDFGLANLYRNDGGRFRDVAQELGVQNVAAGMGVTWGDVDQDGWLDLYVTNMHSRVGSRLTAQPGFRPGSGAGIEAAYRHHALGNALFFNGKGNEKGGAFRDGSEVSGTARGRWGWGSIFLDLDNDGWLDLFAPNGFVSGEKSDDLESFFWRQVVLQSPDGAEPGGPSAAGEAYELGWRAVRRLVRQGHSWNGNERNVAFRNLGQGAFADVSSAAGLDHADDARAAARVDWDGDGDLDLLVTNRTSPMLRVLRNEQELGNRWIALELRAKDRPAIGARVVLETSAGARLVRTLGCGEGYLAQSSARLHFGLGQADVARISVRWPDGSTETFAGAASGALHALEQGSGRALVLSAPASSAPTPSLLAAGELRAPAPGDSARMVLPAPLPLPRLALETWDERAVSMLGISMQGPRGTGQPLLLVLWSSSAPPCRAELERLAAAAAALEQAGLQIVALNVDPPAERAPARALLDELAWPFGRGFTSEEALQILELVQAALHDDARSLPLPAGFLIDASGQLVATYQGRLEPERLRQDLALCELLPAERRDACVPFPGRWIAPPPEPFGAEVAARLAAHGLERPAAEYRLARIEVRASGARLAFEAGLAQEREGRHAQAIASFRKALEEDPGHVPAAQALALVLHQQGDLRAALAAYEVALALEPGHAPTRRNLGYLHLALGDVAGAERELAALRSLQSELASALEERIRQAGER